MENEKLRMEDSKKHSQPVWFVVIFSFQFSTLNY